MIDLIRTTEKTFGSEIKQPTKSEKKDKVARKSIVAKLNISKGENFNFKNLTTKRPGVGISPMLIRRLIGKKSKNNYQKNQLLKKTEVKI